ncbi:CHAT domain-containing protein, partial [Thermodesulfobacteriota bacterium]
MPGAKFTAHTGLGLIYEGQEEYDEAKEFYSKGVEVVEEIRSSLQPAQRKNFYDVRISGFYRSDPAKGLTRVSMKLNQAAESIDSSVLTRARAFSDGVAQRSGERVTGVPPDILEKEADLLNQIAALKQTRAKQPKDKNPERWENITEEIEALQKELDGFIEMLWKKHKAYASVKYPRPVKLKESAVQPDEHLIIYDVVGEGVGVKLIKGKQILATFYTRWPVKELETDVKKFREPFENLELRDFDARLGKKLYKRLLATVINQVPEGSTVIIVPDGILAILPFEALVMEGKAKWKTGEYGDYPEGLTYVGDVYAIGYYQSITALTLARTLGKKSESGKGMLVMADPVFSADDERLGTGSKKRELVADAPQILMSIKGELGLSFPRVPLTGELGEALKKTYAGQTDLYMGMDVRTKLLRISNKKNRYGLTLS